MKDTVYFVSDTHFISSAQSAPERRKRDLFLDFIESCKGASALFLLGDIFDFWFEKSGKVPEGYEEILLGFENLVKSGTAVFITGGNHDFWLGPHFPRKIGVTVLPRESTHELQGKRVRVTHGDSLLPGDYRYKILKSVIRSKPAIIVARLLPLPALCSFAQWFSRRSRGFSQSKTRAWAEKLISIAEDSFFNDGNDALVMGHIHLPVMRRFGDKTFVILGDWENHSSFLRMSEGRFSLESYHNEGNRLIEIL